VAESLIFQCRYNDVTLTWLTLPRGACISQQTAKIYTLYFTKCGVYHYRKHQQDILECKSGHSSYYKLTTTFKLKKKNWVLSWTEKPHRNVWFILTFIIFGICFWKKTWVWRDGDSTQSMTRSRCLDGWVVESENVRLLSIVMH